MVQKNNSFIAFFKNIYYDDYKWALVKSASLFLVGVRIAKECQGLELMPAVPH
ncbi:AAEL004454-PA [Aedes aegypti]|uniref:AAEL004454-PA n=1 Tax=Aedes aegypti TaxID=7159 RepID=Q17CP7_AEDAE|nr:AAEL004454-PA [Aedes aegypti]